MVDTSSTTTVPSPSGFGRIRAALREPRIASPVIFFGLFAALPFTLGPSDTWLLTIAARIMIIALAALTLDLILGYCGMVSFGHAAFIGVGAYIVGISSEHGLEDLTVLIPLTLLICGLLAALMGVIAIRTTGIQFIMITLAMGQMLYYSTVSLARYGGDDGLALWGRSTFLDIPVLSSQTAMYAAVLGTLLVVYLALTVLVHSRFGRVLNGVRQNQVRMATMGYTVASYKVLAFTIAGALCGLAGVLMANLNEFVSPAYISWHRSAELIIILVLGGTGRLHGALWGALVLIGFEVAVPFVFEDGLAELVSGWGPAWAGVEEFFLKLSEHWRLPLAFVLIGVALYARDGLVTLFDRNGK